MLASVLPCNQLTTLYVTSLPQGIAASKANTRLMSAIHCIWVQWRHASTHAQAQTRKLTQRQTQPSDHCSLQPWSSQWSPVSPSVGSLCSPPWPSPLIRDRNRHRFASRLTLLVNLWLTHTGWMTSSSCLPQPTTEVQFRVVKLAAEIEKNNKESWAPGARMCASYSHAHIHTHTHTHTHTHMRAHTHSKHS